MVNFKTIKLQKMKIVKSCIETSKEKLTKILI